MRPSCFTKRVTKSPKLYFYDSALICALLGIKTHEDLFNHPLKGAIFESFIISELFKDSFNHNEIPQLFFWRDVQGHEIDCIIEKTFDHAIPLEIKASKTISDTFFKGLVDWQKITQKKDVPTYVIYGGDDSITRKHGMVVAWQDLPQLLQKLYAR